LSHMGEGRRPPAPEKAFLAEHAVASAKPGSRPKVLERGKKAICFLVPRQTVRSFSKLCLPCAMESPQSSRSPRWARICPAVRQEGQPRNSANPAGALRTACAPAVGERGHGVAAGVRVSDQHSQSWRVPFPCGSDTPFGLRSRQALSTRFDFALKRLPSGGIWADEDSKKIKLQESTSKSTSKAAGEGARPTQARPSVFGR
jgi:hypothetical protein